MKKNLAYYIVLALLTIPAMSCKKYLDLTPTGKSIITSASDYYNLLSLPNRGYPISGNIQYLNDENYLKESSILSLTKGIMTISFYFDSSESRVNYLTASSLYNQAYKYINRWNMVYSLVDESEGEESVKKLAKAEAQVLRAFDHFILVNVFARPYSATAATDGGICIMDKYDIEAKPVKSTVAEVYAFIEKDLDEALPYLQVTPKDVYHPSLAFAWAFKAKVHLFKREWQKAKDAALKALSYNSSLLDLVAYTKAGGPTTVLMPAGSNPETLSYMYVNGYTEMSSAYTFMISPELRALFSGNDTRFKYFFDTTSTTFLDVAAKAAYWKVKYTSFFRPTVGIQVPEVYLTLAEAYARLGELEDAMKYLNALRVKRISDVAEATLATPATIKETMDFIITERRKELMFGYNRFFDLKRYNLDAEYAKTVERKFPLVSTSVPQVTYKLPPNSKLYVIPFSQDVLKKNTSLTINTDETLPW
ncbi:SusD family protein [Filimonas lacunae]|uniref:SusD family protein n=1 Tax=Filimonas lacunae TaxID=477680 RepID=A0A1N7RGF0_9BACT|nr:RagB/SusD family nutrient uptake outer membrane protein [Filimonas lacunae]SIT34226.1 SusD family protein [Filimonas lacunae]